MPKGLTPIGPGEFERHGQPNALLRFEYLQMIRKWKPEVLRALADIARTDIAGRPLEWIDKVPTYDGGPIAAWAQHYNLGDRWLCVVAAMTVNEWRVTPALVADRARLEWTTLPVSGPEEDWPTFEWNPLTATRKEAERRAARYLNDVVALAKTRGYVYSVSGRDPSALEWLVRYQVCGEPKASIVAAARGGKRAQDPADWHAVRARLTTLAAGLEITLRRERPGPPTTRRARNLGR